MKNLKLNKETRLFDLAPGCYTLSTMIVNPAPDKRSARNWTHAATWPAGMRLFVRESAYSDDGPSSYSIENIDTRWTHMCVRRNRMDEARWNALAPHMVSTDETLDYMIHRLMIENSFPYILGELISIGKLTLADIESAYRTGVLEQEKK